MCIPSPTVHPPLTQDNINQTIIGKICKDYVCSPKFDPAKIRNASTAAEGLCKRVIAIEIRAVRTDLHMSCKLSQLLVYDDTLTTAVSLCVYIPPTLPFVLLMLLVWW